MKTYQVAYELAGKLSSTFSKSMFSASESLQNLNNKITQINANQKNISSFAKLEEDIKKTSTQLLDARKKVLELGNEIKNIGVPTRQQTKNFEDAKAKVESLTTKLGNQRQSFADIRNELKSAGVNYRNISAENERLAQSINKVRDSKLRLEQIEAKQRNLGSKKSELYGKMVDTAAMTGMLAMPLKAYADLNQAETDLKMSVMQKGGVVPEQFKELKQQAIELGNKLPGTTADFFQLARALAENGMKLEAIVAKGGAAFKSAAYLAVIMHKTPEAAGEFVAKMREAYQLSEDELPKMADIAQKIKSAFGVNMEDFQTTSEYISSMLGALSVKGEEATKTIGALIGVFAQNGIAGQKAGTGIRELLTGMLKYDELIHKNSKKAEEFRQTLNKYGVKLDFFKNGKFAGLENMVKQIEKLNKITNEKDKLEILKELFGVEGMPAAAIVTKVGVGGLKNAEDRMANVANLQEKIDLATKSYKNILESLQGTAVNLWAAIGEPIAQKAIPGLNRMNDLLGKMQDVMDDHAWIKDLVGYAGSLFTSLVAIKVASIALTYTWALAKGGALALQGTMFLLSNTVIGIRVGLMALAAWQGVVTAAQWAWNVALAANPIVWIIAGIAALIAVGVLLYKNLDTIKEKFNEVWNGIAEWFKNISLYDAGLKLLDSFGDGIRAGRDALLSTLKEIWDKAQEYNPFSDKPSGGISSNTTNPLDSNPLTSAGLKPGGTPMSVTYSPSVVIQGNANKNDMEQAMQQGNGDFISKIRSLQGDSKRLSYE